MSVRRCLPGWMDPNNNSAYTNVWVTDNTGNTFRFFLPNSPMPRKEANNASCYPCFGQECVPQSETSSTHTIIQKLSRH